MAATLKGADEDFARRVNQLMSDTGATLTSGYRSNAEQQALYNQALAKYGNEQEARKWAAKPGGSNHEHGVAADIGGFENITDAQLARYGLYRPMSWEPWHVEPIGSRKSTSAGYTTPPGQDATAKTMEQFNSALAQLGVGAQGTSVGEQQTSVGEQASVVGEQGTGAITAQTTEKPQGAAVSTGSTMATGGGDQLDSLMSSIAKQESGGSKNPYTTPNASGSGAYGKYQIMPSSWAAWTKELGIPNAPMTPENQEKVARYKLGQYLEKYGPAGAAQAWYGGEGSVGKNVSGGSYGGTRYQDSNSYAQQVTGRMK